MSYEYNKGLGTQVVEVYGTLPYAQRWMAEEFHLTEVPSTETITPPISYRKPYSRPVTLVEQGPLRPPPPLPFRGIDSVGSGGYLLAGIGLLLGYLAYRLLSSSQYERNPAIASLRPAMELWSNPDGEDEDEDFSDVEACEYLLLFEDEDVSWEREELGWERRWPRHCPRSRRPRPRYRTRATRQWLQATRATSEIGQHILINAVKQV